MTYLSLFLIWKCPHRDNVIAFSSSKVISVLLTFKTPIMAKTKALLHLAVAIFLLSCSSSKKPTVSTPTEPPAQRIPAKFDFSPPSRSNVAATGITIAIVKPTYVGKNAEYYVPPFNEMATSMGNDFEELLTAKGFTVRGPFGSRDEMVYNDKVNSGFILEIGIDINPQYNRKYNSYSHTNWGAILDKNAPASISTYKMNGEITLGGNLVINAKSSQYGELIWKKNIALESSSFTYTGSLTWDYIPNSMAEELKKDNQVYNTLSRELEKFYDKALNLAWQQIDPAEMKTVAEQAKKADKKQ